MLGRLRRNRQEKKEGGQRRGAEIEKYEYNERREKGTARDQGTKLAVIVLSQFMCWERIIFHYTPDSHASYSCPDYIIIIIITITIISTTNVQHAQPFLTFNILFLKLIFIRLHLAYIFVSTFQNSHKCATVFPPSENGKELGGTLEPRSYLKH